MGKWYDEPRLIAHGDVTTIQLDTPSINTTSKYLKEQ
jgi:hypothetical protein